jgi:DNA repair protein RecN (Recombination protein N)
LPSEKTHWQLAIGIRDSLRTVLVTLRIKNLALVSDLTVELGPGLNVITGETGAGKSVILGGLNLVLGQRADRGAIRSGADSCSVEAVFDITGLRAPIAEFLETNGLEPCDGGQLLLKRILTAAGANRQFINGSPTTLATLSAVGDWLVDLHGPHEHQSLLQPLRQLLLLDAFGRLEDRRTAFAEKVRTIARLNDEKASLIVDESTYAAKLDLLRFQVRELTEAKLDPEEETAVEAEFTRCHNAARLMELAQTAAAVLSENDDSLITQAGNLGRVLREIHRLDPAAAGLEATQESIASALRDLQSDLSSYTDRIDLDPSRLAQLETRLNLIHDLKRKYGGSIAAALERADAARAELASLEGREVELARIDRELSGIHATLKADGKALTQQRTKLLPKLGRAVEQELDALGFRQGRFAAELQPAAATASGMDAVEFQFAPNPGEPARPLRAIASSGELARVMLALKTVLAAEDEIPVLVFDEVDANVGGETATAVGQKMRQIAAHRQVLCITHLAPVAAFGNSHLVVTKEAEAGRTVSRLHRVTGDARIDELARMLGGVSQAARRHASELIESAKPKVQSPKSKGVKG